MKIYNKSTYWSWKALNTSSQEDIAINGYWLQNTYIKTSSKNEWKIIDILSFNHPLNNWRWFLSNYKRGVTIDLQITIKWDNITDFNNRLSEFRKQIFIENSILDIKINWEVRRIIVNCKSAPKTEKHYNITFMKFDVSFESLEPNFYAISRDSRAYLNKTTSFNEEITNLWWDESDLLFYLQFKTWLTWVNTTTITIWSDSITINNNINDNDIIFINWETKSVTLNWIEIDYDWTFPKLQASWLNIVNFIINGTFEVDINVLNKIYYV